MREKVELIKISEQEYRIGENKLSLIEPNLLFVESLGPQTDEIANVFYDFYTNLIKNRQKKTHVIIDINNSKKSTPNARKTWKIMSELEKTGKIALFGLHPVARVLAAFVIRFTNKEDIRFFETKEEALAWVNSFKN